MLNKIDFYKKRLEENELLLKGFKAKHNLVSALRFIDCVILVVFSANYFLGNSFKEVSIAFMVISVILFFALIKWHNSIEEDEREVKNSIDLNSDDIKRCGLEWKEFSDTGEEYLEPSHGFASDLDVFGEKSFFQWVNATRTTYGRECLKDRLLLKNGVSKNEIYKIQDAVKELSEKFEFREKFLSALTSKNKSKEKHFILEWVSVSNSSFTSTGVSVLKYAGPIITLIALALVFIRRLDLLTFLCILAVNFFVVRTVGREAQKGVELFDELRGELRGYVKALELLENENFSSEKLNEIKKPITNSKNASKALSELYGIGSWLNDRNNAFYLIFNAALYWDFHLLAKAEKWKNTHKDDVAKWMNAIGEFEALESISIVYGKDYVMPTINDSLIIEAENVVHPMLAGDGVSNTFNLNEQKRVALITGSNMSGKSTFLRTVGFSMFLTYIGVGVKATSFKTPIVNIYTCMRTADNLNESISSFYAEILRVKNIVDAANRGERIIFLLDEIFKGTNSIDRHEGARVLINQLLKGESIGLVSTHDLELCEMENSNHNIINYNFREYYTDNKLKFDYKLRKGISETRNARYLMRMAGINIES